MSATDISRLDIERWENLPVAKPEQQSGKLAAAYTRSVQYPAGPRRGRETRLWHHAGSGRADRRQDEDGARYHLRLDQAYDRPRVDRGVGREAGPGVGRRT